MEAIMTDVTGTLAKFHLGVSTDGESCVLAFVDKDQRTINCVATFMELAAFITNLSDAANEMCRRRHVMADDEGDAEIDTINVASAAFQLNARAGYIEGSLVGEDGEVVGIRMCPEVACQLTRAMLMSAPAVSRC
jgi:hypothetical protein